MIDNDCIFCKLANGVIPTNTVYENDRFRVILDASPAAKGHALVIPKTHCADALTAPEEVLSEVMVVASKIGNAIKKATGCDGINIIQNNGEAAGQTVFHLHVHVIPRFRQDKIDFEYEHLTLTEEEYKIIAEEIKESI